MSCILLTRKTTKGGHVPPVPTSKFYGTENHNIDQYDGNNSIDSYSLASELSCTCCNSSVSTDTTCDQDSDLENVSAIPVLDTNYFVQ